MYLISNIFWRIKQMPFSFLPAYKNKIDGLLSRFSFFVIILMDLEIFKFFFC